LRSCPLRVKLLEHGKTFLKKQGDVERCLSNIKQAFVIYKESHDSSQWPIFIERIREEKYFKNILDNEEHFKVFF